MGDMLIENKNSRRGSYSKKYLKELFAKEINCTVSLLNNLNELIKVVFEENKDLMLIGNNECRYCGRSNDDKSIWVGIIFEKLIGHKLAVGFFIYETNKKEEDSSGDIIIKRDKLLTAHYNYLTEYAEIDGGYWFFVYVDCSLENYCSIYTASNEIKKIIKDVVG